LDCGRHIKHNLGRVQTHTIQFGNVSHLDYKNIGYQSLASPFGYKNGGYPTNRLQKFTQYMCIYIYIQKEREGETEKYVITYINIYIERERERERFENK
jgi:hypothetical protein